MPVNPAEAKQTMTPAVLAAAEPLPGAPDLAVFTLKPQEGGDVPAFVAGQYTTVGIDCEGEFALRYYSIASAPERRDAFQFYIVRIQGKDFTPELFHLEPGATVWYGEPGGGFTLARTEKRHLAFVGSGTGIAPFVSMLRHLRAEAEAGRPTPPAVTLWHGVRHAVDLGFRAEMEQLEADQPFPFKYVPTISRFAEDNGFDATKLSQGRVDALLARTLGSDAPADEPSALAGRHDAAALAAMLPAGDTGIFLCGNPGMIQAFDAHMEGSAYHADLVYEKFW